MVSSGVSSMAPYSTQPGSRSTRSAACTIMISPRANKPVKTTPIAAPSSTLPYPRIHSVANAVSTPTAAAPRNIGRLSRARNQERCRQSRQDGMADRVAQQAHAPQHEKVAHQGRRNGAEHARQDDPAVERPIPVFKSAHVLSSYRGLSAREVLRIRSAHADWQPRYGWRPAGPATTPVPQPSARRARARWRRHRDRPVPAPRRHSESRTVPTADGDARWRRLRGSLAA